jgi:hypothetical protein
MAGTAEQFAGNPAQDTMQPKIGAAVGDPHIRQPQGAQSSNPTTAAVLASPEIQPIGQDQIRKAYATLRKYKTGKAHLEQKIVSNEKWWKLRHWDEMGTAQTKDDPKPASGWLFNAVISKHADFMDNFPGVDILPREPDDVEEADRLSTIIPVVMEQNEYRQVYSDEVWYKLKQGTGVYGVFWDQTKLNGLGDITIKSMDLLSLYWEPGVTDIQKSQNFFSVELVDNDQIIAAYPQARNELGSSQNTLITKYAFDDAVDTSQKSAVIDWYYKKNVNGKDTVQYCKFVGDVVLYATENDDTRKTEPRLMPVVDELTGQPAMNPDGSPAMQMQQVPVGESVAERGLYDHGKYPFVFDPLWTEAGMPVGFGLIDAGKSEQASIDIFNNAFEKNIQYVAVPRYFFRNDGGINEQEFANPYKLIVHTDMNLGQDSYAPIQPPTFINSNYINLMQYKIDELKETLGNRDTSNGGVSAGVTSASGIAALQESSGKTSRDAIGTTYEAHKKVVTMVIELIRQFYDMPRQFRITGKQGEQEFVTYTNQNLQPQYQGEEFGVDMGYRLPVFDIDVRAEKQNAYSRVSQNDLALQFYNSGFFNPQYADQALACLDMMDFDGKQEMMQKVQANGGMYQQLLQMQQQVLQLTQMVDQLTGGQTNLSVQASQQINARLDQDAAQGHSVAAAQLPVQSAANTGISGENARTARARQQAAQATIPASGR